MTERRKAGQLDGNLVVLTADSLAHTMAESRVDCLAAQKASQLVEQLDRSWVATTVQMTVVEWAERSVET